MLLHKVPIITQIFKYYTHITEISQTEYSSTSLNIVSITLINSRVHHYFLFVMYKICYEYVNNKKQMLFIATSLVR